eukprot:TRINITY_DN10063_c0_g1_i3.p1 TRINITY_DN10063_c0_g1~~TRINITY_DN10063_c0_g1_i3.p1  ORF type:complete len:122 (+),score=25.60 TRINITY_DN10063_c0_g1_i3:63-428(+)
MCIRDSSYYEPRPYRKDENTGTSFYDSRAPIKSRGHYDTRYNSYYDSRAPRSESEDQPPSRDTRRDNDQESEFTRGPRQRRENIDEKESDARNLPKKQESDDLHSIASSYRDVRREARRLK